MVTNIADLRDLHPGSTIYVIGSGASLSFVRRSFFRDKITITVNEAFRDWPSSFALMHHHEHAQEAIDAGKTLVTSEYDCGFSIPPRDNIFTGKHNFRGDYYVYKTEENKLTPTANINAILWNRHDELVISASTVGEAVHFASHLGASSIILCGCDGGCIDGDWNYPGYNGGGKFDNGGGGTNPQHVLLTYHCMMAVISELRNRGVAIYSLNPFVDLRLEGHHFRSAENFFGRESRQAADAK